MLTNEELVLVAKRLSLEARRLCTNRPEAIGTLTLAAWVIMQDACQNGDMTPEEAFLDTAKAVIRLHPPMTKKSFS